MYQRNPKGWLKHFDFILLDAAALILSFYSIYHIQFHAFLRFEDTSYSILCLVMLLLDCVLLFFLETLKNVLKRTAGREWIKTIKHGMAMALLTFAGLYLFKQTGISRSFLIWFFLTYFILTLGSRIIRKVWLKGQMNDDEKGKSKLLVIANTSNCREVIHNLKANNYKMYDLVGLILLDTKEELEKVDGVPVIQSEDYGLTFACREWVDEVFLYPEPAFRLSDRFIHQWMNTGITTHIGMASWLKSDQKQLIQRIGNYTVLTSSMNYTTLKQAFCKRALDILGGLVGCLLTGILYVFLAPKIKKESPGPVFFSQIRIGKNGKRFKMYKFRSMYLDAEQRKHDLLDQNRIADGMMFKLDWDPRIIGNEIKNGIRTTGIGEWIRKTSIDEFPQFFNVLKGDMSLVGTRPPTEDEWEKYEVHHRARLAVKPGITGLWQVSGRSDITDFEEVVRLDTEYIQSWSVEKDIGILLKTLKVVKNGEGSM